MYSESIKKKTWTVWKKIVDKEFLQPFYLAGGTALAIHLGHRLSIDLDFFTPELFSLFSVKNELAKIGSFTVTSESSDGTLNGFLDGVKLSFFVYPYKNVYPLVAFKGLMLADERDIAAMKIDAISSRGSKKDFIDLYFLLKKYSLAEIIGFFETRYRRVKYNRLHILKSLSYFDDAEADLPPVMLKKVDWEEIKKIISGEAKKILI